MKTFLLFCFVVVGSSLFGQDYYHDPSLDSIVNNVGYVDSDLNATKASVQNLPQAIVGTNLIMSQIVQQGLTTVAGSGNTYLQPTNSSIIVVYGSASGTNRSAMSLLVTNSFSAFASNNFTSSFAITNDPVDGSPFSAGLTLNIALPGGGYAPMDFSYQSGGYLPTWLPSVVCSLIITIMWCMVFVWLFGDLKKHINETMQQRQVQGSTEEVLGVSVSAVAGLGYAVAITVALAVAVGVVLTSSLFHVLQSNGSFNYLMGQIASFAGMSGISAQWNLITVCLPIFQLLNIYVYYLFFSNLVLEPAFKLVRVLIFWFVN